MGIDKKDSNDYFIYFRGAKITKQDSIKVGLGIFFGIGGVIIAMLLPPDSKYIDYPIIVIFALVGYLLGNKFSKK